MHAYHLIMQCNINAKGKRIRLIGGFITMLVAVVFAILTMLAILPWWGWFIAGGTAVGGAFQIYEGWAGWCAIRAMGFKTPV